MAPKDKMIVMRVDEDTKRRLEKAAQRKGKTMTTFLVEAADREARRVERQPIRGGVHGSIPAYFRANCFESSRGGDRGYDAAGWHLAIHLDQEMPDDADLDEWSEEVQALVKMLDREDDEGVLAWFDRHFPKCMELIPPRRRMQFLKGVKRAHEEERIE